MKISRLKKLNNSFKIGDDFFPPNENIVEQIKSKYPILQNSKLKNDFSNKEALWGAISDDLSVVAEVYCFTLASGEIAGVAVGKQLNISDPFQYKYELNGLDIQSINFNSTGKTGGEGNMDIINSFREQTYLFGKIVSFSQAYSSIDDACHAMQERLNEQN